MEVPMRTNIDLDDTLVDEAMKVSGAKTKKEVVDLALRALIKSRVKKDLLDLVGQIDIDPDFDHKKARRTRYDAG
jgi:Arc/MetJ family transcription regulator